MAVRKPNAIGTESFRCLILEDDEAFASLLASVVEAEGGQAVVCGTVAAAREAVARRPVDLALLDNHLPDGKGYDFFGQFARQQPELPMVMITGVPDLGEAVALTRNGLFDYLTKPVSADALEACLRRVLLRLAKRAAAAGPVEWFGDSPAVRAVVDELRVAARHRDGTVLLTGETGVGKDLAARVLHQLTFEKAAAPFVAVNCAALPAEMFEAELFGAERGAYTGADRRRPGLVAAAQGGTLFLDEIAEVPLGLQAKLLRLLEAREFRMLGGTASEPFTGRFVAATNKVLADEVRAGRFREDLLYRLDVLAVTVPPLRHRREDIAGLSEVLLRQLCTRYDRSPVLLQPPDLAALAAHDFPGNIRELRNILERSLLRTLPDSRWLTLNRNWTPRTAAATSAPTVIAPSGAGPTRAPGRELTPLEAQEYQMIRQALVEANGGIRRAATRLGLSPQALLRRLEKWPELRSPGTP